MNLKNKTNEELLVLREKITSDPKNKNVEKGSLFIYTKEAQRKLFKIDWAITNNMAQKRKENGNPVPCDGYSGRQTNKRR